MTLETLESISVIAASWIGIICGIISLLKGKEKSSNDKPEKRNSSPTRYGYRILLKWVRFYLLAIVFFALLIASIVIKTKVVSITDVLTISSCVGAIILMLVATAYKYTIWKTMRELDSDIEY
ncbi:hypothetical protein [Halomonas sp. G11]|uniref:hypothetical protein n=1 Tax=Halomonas sp. G11 TaxID=1684425 RepID=UPI0007FE65CF|nr:hypothetical protein [Halomonas sp. G11]OAZ99913.1 hypothetical protein ADS46_12550 [Halomonas sp. G11]